MILMKNKDGAQMNVYTPADIKRAIGQGWVEVKTRKKYEFKKPSVDKK